MNVINMQLSHLLLVVKGSKDEVELPRRKRVKEEQEAEEVSTVTSGKVLVSTTGSARIVVAASEKTALCKLTTKTRTKNSVTKKDGAVLKNKSSFKSAGSRTAVKKLKKTTQNIGKTLAERPASKFVKQSVSQQQQPLKKKRRRD